MQYFNFFSIPVYTCVWYNSVLKVLNRYFVSIGLPVLTSHKICSVVHFNLFHQGFLGNLNIQHTQITYSYFIHLLLQHQTCFHKHMVILFQPEKCKVTKQFNLVNFFENGSVRKTRLVIFEI